MPKSTTSDIQFLAGGGEMGQLIREKDWSKTPLGNPETWPQSLRTTLGILLNSKFPMFLWWGPELICFYNDAYRPSLGKEGKHPAILGMNASEAWPEIWDIIKPMIDSVFSTGEATWNEDALIPIYRNNKIEDVYWTFSYSPVYDENSEVAGVLVTCNETTDKVNAFKELKESNQRFLDSISQAPVAMCIFRGKDYVVEMANDLMLEIWGKETSVVMNEPLFKGLPEIQDQGIKTILDNVFATGEKFVANEWEIDLLRNGKIETAYVDFVCEALRESDGSISGIIGTATEITKQVNSRIKLEETEQKIRALVENAPVAIAVYTGREMRIELANQAIMDIWGKGNDVIGKTFTEVLPELAGQSVFEQIKEVYATGKPFHNENQALDLVVNGKLGTYYFNYDFIPLYDISGKIYGVMNTAINLTDLNLAKQKIEESNARFKNTVKQAPVGMIILRGKDYVVEMVNDAYMKIVDFNESEFVGLPLFDSIPEARESTLSLMDQVMETGEPFYGYEVTVPLRRNNKIEFCNFDFVYHPLKEDDGSISGMIVTVTDVTEKVASRRKIEESEARFRNTVKQSPVGILILRGRNYIAELANDTYLQLVDRKESGFLNRPLFDSLPEIEPTVHSFLDGVMDTGEEYHGNEMPIPVMRNGKIGIYYFDFLYRPLKEDDGTISGIIVTVTDVTEKVESHKKIERNEERLNIVIEASELGTWELNLKTSEVQYSQRYLEILGGYKERVELTHQQLKQHVHPDDREIREKAINEALATGHLHYEGRTIWDDKSIHWIEGRGKVFYDEKGEPEKMIGTIRDITNERMFTQELEKQVNERTKELKKLNETLKQSEKRYHLMVEEIQDYAILYMTKEGIVENWNKGAEKIKGYKAEEIIGKNFATFYTHEDRENQLPEYLLKQAILHGRHHHEGWRVRKDGTRFWASVVITAVHNDDNEIIGFSKVTHDLTTKKEADDQIKLNSEMLEQKNKELEKMNKELQSFAYISSHDLQEPLRKIQTFADQIVERESQNLSENGKDKFRRMQNAAKRMQTLINDLLAYSRTTNQDVELIKANLNNIIEDVKEDLKEEIQQKKVTIEIGEIGEANIIPFQFHQLMFNLLSNSLKFSRKDVPLHIKIQGEIAKGNKFNTNKLDNEKQYSHITFSDNGIGFEQQYGEKIFEVFQRLHGKEVYQGTGIGLAIVKKIVDNHNGIITARGELGKGATFDIYIPVS